MTVASSPAARSLGPFAVAVLALLLAPGPAAQTVYTVTTTADAGTGSLRQAILDANAHPNGSAPDRIHFAIPGAGVRTIQPLTELPAGTDPVVIDGTTQPGASCAAWPPTLLIELDGSLAGASGRGLRPGVGSEVRGLVVNRFGNAGIQGALTARCNFIGTDPTGTLARGNGLGAWVVEELGGPLPTDRNLISGNTGPGVYSVGAGGRVRGNYIGTDVTGLLPLGNQDGLFVNSGGFTAVGGPGAGEGNVIAGNTRAGLYLSGGGFFPVQGNHVGVGADGTTPVPNGTGILIPFGSSMEIGGTAPGAGNVIAGNTGAGVAVQNGTGHRILRNRMGGNGGPGIDLGAAGPTANDPGDGDTGANNLQNAPAFTSAAGDGVATLTLVYTVASTTTDSAYPLTVEFFLADAAGEEGAVYLGTSTYTAAQAQAPATAAFTPAAVVANGDRIVATATDAAGNTSEFSAPVTVVGSVAAEPPAGASLVTALGAPYPNPSAGAVTVTYTLAAAGPVHVAVYDALGRRVAVLHDGEAAAGRHAAVVPPGRLPPGVYLARLVAGPAASSRRITVVR